jgi:hypothetical protein
VLAALLLLFAVILAVLSGLFPETNIDKAVQVFNSTTLLAVTLLGVFVVFKNVEHNAQALRGQPAAVV